MKNDFSNLGFGLGLRSPHYEYVMEEKQDVDWFEIISDNYIAAHKGYWQYLYDLRQDYPIVMHGVSLSIGSTDPLNVDYLNKLKNLADYIDAKFISDHLCYTGLNNKNTHDLLPIPYTEDALQHIIPRIEKAQEILGRELVFENASSYLEFSASHISEAEFLNALSAKTGAKILLDVNNVYVSSFNHGWDAHKYIDTIAADAIVQYHLSGHTDKGSYLFDTHDDFVADPVWQLYNYTIKQKGQKSTLLEWDDAIPEFSVLLAELNKARNFTKNVKDAA